MLTSLDSLFTTQEQRDEAKRDSVQDIPISQISDFPEHPFKVKQDEAMLEMAESVRQYGVLVPGLVRQLEDGSYQMVSGHRRKLASELAGRDTIPCIVRDLTDDEAVIIMVDSNLQRERVLPSEKAFAYKMKLDAMRRQAGRPSKENGVPLGHHFQQGKSREILADNSPDSNTQIQRYIRLTNLIPEILDMVDDGRIAFRPAVELSYLTEQEQCALYDTMGREDCTPSLAQAIKMKAFSRDGKLTDAVILSIMAEEKPNQKEQFRIPKERISKYFKPGTPARTMEELGGGEYALTGLCYGGYFAKEAQAPEGFYLDENAYYFAITTDGETVTVENEAGKGFVNAAQVGSLRIVKTSSDGKLEGFSFRVTGANGYDQVFQTDAEGFILVEGLRIGDYTVSEVRDGSSDGYLLPADKTASIFEGAVTEVEMHNEKKPTPKVPQTGDSSHAALWLALLGLSGIGAAAVLLMRKRKK